MTYNNKRSYQTLFYLLLMALITSLSLSSCDVFKLGRTIKDLKEEAKPIGKNLGAGVVDGVDTTQLDSMIKRLANLAGSSLSSELDSVSFRRLEDSLNVVIRGIISEAGDSIKVILADTSALDDMDAKLQGVITRLGRRLDRVVANIIPNALNDQNRRSLYALRDSLLGPTTAYLLREALLTSVGDLAESTQLDSLIRKVDQIVENASTRVDETAKGISKTVVIVGAIIGGVLLIALLVLWLRKRAQAKQQKQLLVKLTKAIDAIPSKDAYDHTIKVLQDQISNSEDPKQHEMLKNILKENIEQYPQKQKYRSFYDRMMEAFKASDADGSVRRRILNNTDDEDFADFIKKNLE